MSKPSLWERMRGARIVQVLAVYVGASWVVLQIAETLQGLLALPDWVGPVAVLLLLIGLVVVLATAWVQSLPQTTAAEAAGEVPTDWEVDAAGALESLRRGKLPHLTWGRAIVGGVVALSLLFGISGAYVLLRAPGALVGPREVGAESVASGIAVLPFQVSGADLEVYREGMVDLMSANLDGLSRYRAIDSRTVLARWNREAGETTDIELDQALRIAAGTGARYAVVGSGVEAGPSVRFTARIYDLSNGSQVGDGGRVEGTPDEVLELVDALTVEVMRSVLDATGQSSSAQTFRLASLLTESVPALRHYLEGDALFRRARFTDARQSLERAIEEDSTFALAYWRLGETLGWEFGINNAESKEMKRRAGELGDRLPEREATLLDIGAAVSDGRGAEVVGTLRSYLERYPDDPDGWYNLGEIGLHSWSATGVSDADLEEALYKAVDLDPTFSPYYEHALHWASAKGHEERFTELMAGQAEAGDTPVRRERIQLRWDLLWGDEAARAAAVETISAMDPAAIGRVDQNILGLADENLDRLEPLLRARPGALPRVATLRGQQGRLRDLLAMAEEADAPEGFAFAATELMLWHERGGGVPDDLLDAVEARLDDIGDSAPAEVSMARARLSVVRGDPGGFEAARATLTATLDEEIPAAAAAGLDTLGVRGALLDGLESRRLVQSGDVGSAYRLLARAVDATPVNLGLDGELGWLAVEAGLWQDAIRILEGISRVPRERSTAKYLLGRVYETTGDDALALDAYRTFLSRTAGGDPDLPAVEHARAAVERLTR